MTTTGVAEDGAEDGAEEGRIREEEGEIDGEETGERRVEEEGGVGRWFSIARIQFSFMVSVTA